MLKRVRGTSAEKKNEPRRVDCWRSLLQCLAINLRKLMQAWACEMQMYDFSWVISMCLHGSNGFNLGTSSNLRTITKKIYKGSCILGKNKQKSATLQRRIDHPRIAPI